MTRNESFINPIQKCSICKEAFITKTDLNNHISSIHNRGDIQFQPPIKCKVCEDSKKCRCDSSTFEHEDESKKSSLLYQCMPCKAGFNADFHLKDHVKKIHGGIPVFAKCGLCSRVTVGVTALSKHMTEAHSQKYFECPVQECFTGFSSKQILENHLISIHGKKVAHIDYPYGPRPVYSDIEIGTLDPESRKFNRYVYTCSICKKIFSSKKGLEGHTMNFHDETNSQETTDREVVNNEIPCEICNLNFTIREDLRKHIINVHVKRKKFKCDICDAELSQKSSLKKHISRVHENAKPIQCTICPERFKRKETLQTHMKKVHSKNHKCDICFLRFLQESDLTEHVSSVHGGKKTKSKSVVPRSSVSNANFKCFICHSVYETKRDFTKHILKIHEGKKPLICPYCGEKFISITLLTAHKTAVHEEEH